MRVLAATGGKPDPAKRSTRPFHSTGHLMRQVASRIDVSGTANKVKGVMRYGRPAFHTGLGPKLAANEFLLGYGADSTAVFQVLFTTVNQQEEKTLARLAEERLREVLTPKSIQLKGTIAV